MSDRTAGANRAIRDAWRNEKRLVLEGKGTRDWTAEQQKQIKDFGKAYDAKGRAFEGQHMKSVSAYPEYQADPRNIQLLSREEHLAAHGGSWLNLTNGYYDPVTMTMSDFGNDPPQPCVETPLTHPLYADPVSASSKQTSGKEDKRGNPLIDADQPARWGRTRQWTQKAQRAAQWAWRDPVVRTAAASVITAVATEALNGTRSAEKNLPSAPSTQPPTRTTSGPGVESSPGSRQSPEAHGVTEYTKKDGTIVRSHQRGGKTD